MTDAFITIDLGTTRLKVAAFDPEGRLLHQVARRHKQLRDGDAVRQDADRWWQDVVAAVREVVGVLDGRQIGGFSLSGRGNAGVFLDEPGNVIAQPWSDARHRPYLDELDRWRKRKDSRFLSNYGAGLISKLRWLQRHAPDTARKIHYACYGKDFILYRLTGTHYTDWSSGPDRERWGDDIYDELDIPRVLPRPALPWSIAGGLSRQAADALGLSSGIPVAVGAHDGICANVGAGATRPGEYAVTLGTHAVTRTVTTDIPDGAYRFYCLPPDRHVIGGNALMGGRSADWFLDLIDPDSASRGSLYRSMDAQAAAVEPGANGVRFMPFLSGQVSPRSRPRASGAFHGMHVDHGRAQLYRSVLEGVAFAIADIFEQIEAWCGRASKTRLTGGGADSMLWPEILANVLDRPLELSDSAVEGRGAAVFLAVGLGRYRDYDSAADAMVPITRRIEADPETASRYRTIHGEWRAAAEVMSRLDR